MAVIHLIRHGEIPQSVPRRFVGQSNLPLTERGRRQMARLGAYLAAKSIDRVICSPLSRSLESARIVALHIGCDVEMDAALKEISLGQWEGLQVTDVRRLHPGGYEARERDIAGFRPAGGESFNDLLARVWPVFETLAGADGTTAVVCHAGVNRVLLCQILGIPLENLFRLGQNFGCLNSIECNRSDLRVALMNFCP